jgi:hypothetical protein
MRAIFSLSYNQFIKFMSYNYLSLYRINALISTSNYRLIVRGINKELMGNNSIVLAA